MSRKKENAPIQNLLKRIFTSPQLMGTSNTSMHPGTDQRVPEKQIFPKEQCHHQLPIGLEDPIKTKSPETTLGLLVPDRGRVFQIKRRNRQGFHIWKKNPELTYHTDGKQRPAFIYKQ
jgi:hypothetical protein